MFGAIVGYEGLITKGAVPVYEQDGAYFFKDINEDYFHTDKMGFSTDSSYFYFISSSEREVNIYLEGVRVITNILREIIN